MRIGIRRFSVLRTELLNSYEEGSKLAGVIYIHRISDNRFSGISGRNFNLFRKLCGESTLKNVLLVTNMWKQDSQVVNEGREKQLSGKFFKPALDKGAKMVRHYNTAKSAHDIIQKIINNNPTVLQIQREIVDEHKNIIDTAAGESINRELKEQIKKHQAELRDLRKEMMEALKAKDEEARQELEEAKRDLEEKILKIEKATKKMVANYAVEKERAEARMREMEQELKQERERAKAGYERNLGVPTGYFRRTPNMSADDRGEWEQEIKKFQDRTTIPIC